MTDQCTTPSCGYPRPVPEAVSATLRKIADWVESDADRRQLRIMAGQVERDAVDGWGATCPLCEEVECDEDCPLREERVSVWTPDTPSSGCAASTQVAPVFPQVAPKEGP